MSSPYYSDCCGAQATGEMMDYRICPECKEHCDFEFYDEDEEDADLNETFQTIDK